MDFMIDIETLGKKPGSIIASIGVVEFDPRAGTIGREASWSLNLSRQLDRGFVMELDTVEWWLKQSDAARIATFGSVDRDDLPCALGALKGFIEKDRNDQSGIWANSPSFDLAHLEYALGHFEIAMPWTYRQPRDCRTAFALAGFDYKAFSNGRGVAHDALSDARIQALGVIEAHKAVR